MVHVLHSLPKAVLHEGSTVVAQAAALETCHKFPLLGCALYLPALHRCLCCAPYLSAAFHLCHPCTMPCFTGRAETGQGGGAEAEGSSAAV